MYNILLEGQKIIHWSQSNHCSATVVANGKIGKYWPVSVLVSSTEKLLALFVTVMSQRPSKRPKFPPFLWPSPVSANLSHTPFPTIISSSSPYIMAGMGYFLHTSFIVLGPYWQTHPSCMTWSFSGFCPGQNDSEQHTDAGRATGCNVRDFNNEIPPMYHRNSMQHQCNMINHCYLI